MSPLRESIAAESAAESPLMPLYTENKNKHIIYRKQEHIILEPKTHIIEEKEKNDCIEVLHTHKKSNTGGVAHSPSVVPLLISPHQP